MQIPKKRYPRSVARRLRPRPCPDCGKSSPARLHPEPGLTSEPDPEMSVAWHCPDNICERSDGFWAESQ